MEITDYPLDREEVTPEKLSSPIVSPRFPGWELRVFIARKDGPNRIMIRLYGQSPNTSKVFYMTTYFSVELWEDTKFSGVIRDMLETFFDDSVANLVEEENALQNTDK